MNQRIALRLGLWSSVAVAILGATYLALLVAYFAIEGFVFPPTPFVQLIGGLVTILTAPCLLMVFAAIEQLASPDKRVLARLGLAFTGLFAAMVSINRFVQLTVIRQSPPSADLARFVPYATDSVMFALEMLGWGFFLSLAALSMAPLFGGDRLGRALRGLLAGYAFFSLLSVVGYVTATPLTAAGFVAWGPILLALAILLAIRFRRAEGQALAAD